MNTKPDRPSGPDRGRHPRHFWREKSHQESHAQGEGTHLGPILAHPLASAEPPTLVTTGAGLAEMAAHLEAAGAFAFDSEFIGERSYEPLLCLVQVATPARVFLVDPLASLDLSALWELIVSPSIEKIVVAGQQDFGPAVQRTGRPPANILDVQIAAGFVQAEYPRSLAKLLAEFVGATLGKAHTFTHWDHRPLSAEQVRYAADDVRYLPAARDAVGKRLAELGRTAWAKEECAAALEDLAMYLPAPETLYQRVRGRDRLRPRELAILRELAIVRDQGARQENVPTRSWVKDSILAAMARHPARKPADLAAIKGLPRPVELRYGPRIVEATARAMALPESQWPTPEPYEGAAMEGRVDKFLADIARVCLERSIAPSLVASRKDVLRACLAARDGDLADPPRLLRGWRKELLGDLLT